MLSGQRTYFVGGPGNDEITTGLDGNTIDCAGGGTDATNRFDSKVTFIGCGSAPTVAVEVRRVRLRTFLKKGVQFTATCSQACGLSWQLMPAAKRDQKAVGKRRSFKFKIELKVDNELTVERVVDTMFTLTR